MFARIKIGFLFNASFFHVAILNKNEVYVFFEINLINHIKHYDLLLLLYVFSGSLQTRMLTYIVKKEDLVLNSEYLTTLLVVVPRSVWIPNTESISSLVYHQAVFEAHLLYNSQVGVCSVGEELWIHVKVCCPSLQLVGHLHVCLFRTWTILWLVAYPTVWSSYCWKARVGLFSGWELVYFSLALIDPL